MFSRRVDLFCAGLFFFGGFAATVGTAAALQHEAMQQQGMQLYSALPLIFEENRGQTAAAFDYLSHADGYTLLLGRSQAVLQPSSGSNAASSLALRWVGASAKATVTGEGKLGATSNYFVGGDSSQWMTGIANFRQVEYRQIYHGIDLIYYGSQRQLEYDLHIAPGIDPRRAELAFDGASSVSVDSASGELLVVRAGGMTRLHKPVAYQQAADGERRGIEVSYHVELDRHVRFHLGRYDHHRDLVIDPTVVYGSYFGGAAGGTYAFMVFLGIGTDASGNIYVAGYQQNPQFPTTASYQQTCLSDPAKPQNCYDYFIAKFNPSASGASSLIYSTYIGTPGGVSPAESDFFFNRSFAVDAAGNAYLAGVTEDAAFPTTASAYEPHCYQMPETPTPTLCDRDISFLTKLDPSGSALLYSTYFGDPDFPSTFVLAADSNGRAFVAGTDASAGTLPVTDGNACPVDSTDGLCVGNFIGAFDTTKSGAQSLIYLKYITLNPTGLATDGLGNAYAYGEVEPQSPPTYAVPNGYQTVSDGGGSNTLLQKFDIGGNITYGTFYQATTAGATDMHAAGVAVDPAGRAYVTGYANSQVGNQNLPNLNGLPVPATSGCCSYVYLGAIDTTQSGGASLLYGTKVLPSTLSATEELQGYAFSVATDGAGKVLLAAQINGQIQPASSASPLYPIVNPLASAAPGGQTAALTLIDTTLSGTASLLFSSPINGSANLPMQAYIDAADNLYLAGSTGYSAAAPPPLPTTSNGYEPQVASGITAPYLLKINLAGTNPAPTITFTAAPTTVSLGQSSTLTWSSTNATACAASGSWSGDQSVSGTQQVAPTAVGTATYTLICTGAGGSATASVQVTVTSGSPPPAPTVTLAATPTTIVLGQSTQLSWSSTNATTCTASSAWTGAQALSGSTTETPTAAGTLTYILTCTGSGSTAATATLIVTAATPTVTIAISPASITLGQSATLTWSSTNATSCTASGAWSGTQSSGGSLPITPTDIGNNTYTLVCDGATEGISATAAAVLQVQAAPIVVTAISGKAGGGGLGVGTVLGLLLLVALRLRRVMKPQGLAAVALIMVADFASAQESPTAYVGIRAGFADYTENSTRLDNALDSSGETTTATSVTQHRVGGVVYAGIPFYRALSFEIGFADLGTYPVGISTQSTNIPALAQTIIRKLPPAGRGLTFDLAAPLNIAPWLALAPRLGLLAYQSKQEVFTPRGTFSDDRKSAGLDGGLALLLFPHRPFSFGAGVDCFASSGRCNVLLYSAVLEYHFGGR